MLFAGILLPPPFLKKLDSVLDIDNHSQKSFF
jgi:hypothetical protein